MLSGSTRCLSVMILSRWPKILMLGAALTLTQAAVRPAQAEIDLGTWETYATMAEQGAVCGAFADIIAMQVLVDEKLGRLLVASMVPIFLDSATSCALVPFAVAPARNSIKLFTGHVSRGNSRREDG